MTSLVLGFSNHGHDSAAAVFGDGVLLAAVAEERLDRVKCSGGAIPQRAIDEALHIAGATRRDVNCIGMSRAQRFRTEVFLGEEGFRPETTVRCHGHHDMHAVLGGFYSGFDECLVFTADGQGDGDEAHTTSIYLHGMLRTLAVTEGEGRSPGLFYQTITELLGFRALRHEGKVLGLAALGDPAPLLGEFRKALRATPCRTRFDSDFTHPHNAQRDRRAFLENAIRGHDRENIAAAAQRALEEAFLAIVQQQVTTTGIRRVALNGGVAANVRLNQRIAALPEVESLFVFPAMSDAGNAVGAALLAIEAGSPGFLGAQQHALVDVFLGPEYGDAEIEQALEAHGLRYAKLGEAVLVERAARAIHDGLVVGWFQGRMEFGPRALGNRSILARATATGIGKLLNERLERNDFMPFAPGVLAERADDVFIGVGKAAHAAEFMTVTFDVREEWKPRIPAVVHVDGTARSQLVRAERNALYHALIRRYSEMSGIPLLLNTSFNAHEEPIVCTPAEAIRALREDRIDALAIGPFWVDRPLRKRAA
ncbi:MAG: hypothetical protein M0Q22_03535 [Sulfuritalea sp.]|jgi:carbamoyltransferase|nr:hypothetical protein [Sulfuritalea sp.]